MRKILPLVALAGILVVPSGAHADVSGQGAHTVLALIDTGINPYSPAFRDCSPEAYEYPGTYLPGYPAEADTEHSAVALNLTLVPCPGDPPQSMTYAERIANDAAEWRKVFNGLLYWVPGTKIVGAVSLAAGGTNCHTVPDVPPAGGVVNGLACKENRLLDDAGHGTMTASRSAGVEHSLGSAAKIVEVEGPGSLAIDWVAARPWIDVVSNSWGSAAPGPSDVSTSLKTAVSRQLWVFASGNGLGFTNGFAPQPTYIEPTGVAGVVLVGAHDNGRVAAWSEAPAHVVADGYGGWTGIARSVDAMRPDPVSCCTSAAAPYAAGGAAAIVQAARALVGDTGTGVREGFIVAGAPHPEFGASPLADGTLTLDELKYVLFHSAEARPAEGADDGLLHFLGAGSVPQHPEFGPGENPFCVGCWTLPVSWSEVPDSVEAHRDIGYGAINERSVAAAIAILEGAPASARPEVDAWYAEDQQVRRQIFGP